MGRSSFPFPHRRWGAPLSIALCSLALGLILPMTGTAGSNPAVEGQWSGVQAWPLMAVHTSLLATGKVLVWGADYNDSSRRTDCRIWDPVTEQFVARVANSRTNLFCAGHSFLPDGRLLVTGGRIGGATGPRDTNIFNPFTNRWSSGASMNAGRWYPNNTTLANGEVLTVAGIIGNGRGTNTLPQVWTTSGRWRSLTRAQRELPSYSFMHLAPNGRVFYSGPTQTTSYLDTKGVGAWTTVASQKFNFRNEGCSVLYDDGKVLTLGGHDPPTATAEVIDLNAARPAWRSVRSMAYARRQGNATLLPDGKVLVTGGSSGSGFSNEGAAVLQAELWDPRTETFTRAARQAVPRCYHSTTLLLPDGRVLSAGGEPEGDEHRDAEIYYPPYLFRGERPVIGGAPASVTYGQSFLVETEDTASIRTVTWLRLGSVTHDFDMDARINRLSFKPAAGGLAVTAPSNRNLCPPGYYMLFILDGDGVPSVARIIRIG
jgi:galactose oxidase-like protein